MKKIFTLLLTFLIVQTYAQDPAIRITSHTTDTDSDVKKPLIELSYQGNNVVLGRFANLDGINPDWISTVNVLKGASAVALYGKEGKDGVISIGLKSSPEIKTFFENEAAIYKKLTKIDKWQDASLRVFEEEKQIQDIKGLTIRVRDDINYLENPPMIIVEFGDEQLELNKIQDLDLVQIELVDEVRVLKDDDSLKSFNAEDRSGVVVMKMKSDKKSAKEFKKLKKAFKKNK
ncbi:MAG: hypothetical protein HWE21_16025 [Cytophagia bacterium]|nr:hypothetical protein [Cytophagia bacterium]